MPSYPCRWPTCSNYVRRRGGYCEQHAEQGRKELAERSRYYDQHLRDPAAKRFYDSAAWHRARAVRLAEYPVCERCRGAWAAHVHHRIPLGRCTPVQRLEQSNLMAVCAPCHNVIEAEAAKDE